MSFVSDGGANCFALPPVPPADGEGGEGSAGPASDTTASPSGAAGGEVSGLVIPRRLQHRQGLGRRLSMQPDAPSLQVCWGVAHGLAGCPDSWFVAWSRLGTSHDLMCFHLAASSLHMFCTTQHTPHPAGP